MRRTCLQIAFAHRYNQTPSGRRFGVLFDTLLSGERTHALGAFTVPFCDSRFSGDGPCCNRLNIFIRDYEYLKMPRTIGFVVAFAFFICVLPKPVVTAKEYIVPGDDAPMYELSNVRKKETKPGWVQILIDFKRTKEGKGTVFLEGRSAQGMQAASVPVFSHVSSGTIKFESYAPPGVVRSINLEFYCVRFNHWRSEMYRYELVSNSVRVGDPGESVTARQWTQEEQEAKAEYLRTGGPQATPLNEKPLKEYKVTIELPSDSLLVPALAKVPEEMKLQACYSSKWNPITALAENEDGTLTIRWDDYGPTFDCRMLREELIIKKTMLVGLETYPKSPWKSSKPETVIDSGMKQRKSHPVTIAIPLHSQPVPDGMRIKSGAALEACYEGKWGPITALSENSDDSLNVRWNEYGESFDCSMLRKELIIRKSVLKELGEIAEPEASDNKPMVTNEVRLWIDKTGKFEVRAKMIRQTQTEVTLLTEKGKEVTLPKSKLSKSDCDFLDQVEKEINPFE